LRDELLVEIHFTKCQNFKKYYCHFNVKNIFKKMQKKAKKALKAKPAKKAKKVMKKKAAKKKKK